VFDAKEVAQVYAETFKISWNNKVKKAAFQLSALIFLPGLVNIS